MLLEYKLSYYEFISPEFVKNISVLSILKIWLYEEKII